MVMQSSILGTPDEQFDWLGGSGYQPYVPEAEITGSNAYAASTGVTEAPAEMAQGVQSGTPYATAAAPPAQTVADAWQVAMQPAAPAAPTFNGQAYAQANPSVAVNTPATEWSPDWLAFDEQQQAETPFDMGADEFAPDPGSEIGQYYNYDESGNIAGLRFPDFMRNGVPTSRLLWPQAETWVKEPDLNAGQQTLTAANALEQWGLPSELARLVPVKDIPTRNGTLGYFTGDFTGLTSQPFSNRDDPYVAVHEALHAFDHNLPPDKLAELRALIDAYPPPENAASAHHPTGLPSPAPTGLTAYFDSAHGVEWGGNKYSIPTPILQFIRENTGLALGNAEATRQSQVSPTSPDVGDPMLSTLKGFDWTPDTTYPPPAEQGYQGLATGQQTGFDATGGETAGGAVQEIVARQAANRAAMPDAWQAIIGMDTPSDLASDPTTPFNRAAPIDPLAAGVRGVNWLADVSRSIPLLPGADRFGLDAPTSGEAFDAVRNAILYGVESAANARTNVTPLGAYSGDPEASRAAADMFLPRSPLELGLEFIPGIGSVPDIRRGLRGVAGEALDELPEAAARGALGNTLQNPASVGGAVPPRLPGGVMAGGADETLGGIDDILPASPASGAGPSTPPGLVASVNSPAAVPAQGVQNAGAVPDEIDWARQIGESRVTGSSSVQAGVQPSAIRRVAGSAVPSLKYPRTVQVANAASDAVNAQSASWIKPEIDVAKGVQAAFDATPPTYTGGRTSKVVGSVTDFLEHPWEYTNVSGALTAARQQWDDTFDASLKRLAEKYGVEVDPFYPKGPNGERGSYVPHMESPDAVTAREKAGEMGPSTGRRSTGRVSVQKERGIASLDERLTFDPTFEPDLDLVSLAARHGAQMTDAASRATYRTLIDGKTGLEILQDQHPKLLAMRERLTRQVTATKSRIAREQANYLGGRKAAELTEQRAAQIQDAVDAVNLRISELGDEYGPELSYLSGELRQMTRQLKEAGAANAQALAKAEAGIVNLTANLSKLIDETTKLSDLRQTIATVNTKRLVKDGKVTTYAFDPITNKWVTPDVARASKAISDTQDNGILKLFEEGRAWQLNGGDLSPVTYGRAQMGAFGYGKTALQAPKLIAQAISMGDDVWQGVDQEMLKTFQGLRGGSVTKPLAEVRPDDVKRGMDRVPKIGPKIRAANDTANRVATFAEFAAWETATRHRMRLNPGKSLQDIGGQVMQAMNSTAPRLDLTKYGLSRTQQRILNAPFTSLSYMAGSPQFVVNNGKAGMKLIANLRKTRLNDPVAAWKALSIADQETLIHGAEMAATVSVISATTAALFDDRPNMSFEEKMLDAMNPLGEKGWTFQLPGGYGIPMATPLRAGLRTANRVRKDGPAAAGEYVANRLINVASIPYHLYNNEDYAGERIRDGNLINQAKQSILYGLEGAAIVTSAPIRAARTGEGSLTSVVVDTAANQAGFNLYEPRPLSVSSRKAINDAIEAGVFPKEMADVLKGADWSDLTSTERTLLRNFAIETGNKKLLDDINTNESRLQRTDSIFAKKRDEVNDDWKDAAPQLDALWNSLRTGAAPAKDVMDELARIEDDIAATYNNRDFDKAVAELPDRDINKLLDQYYSFVDLSKQHNGGVPNWVMVEQARNAWLADLDPADAARVKLNVAGAIPADAHPMRQFVSDMQPVIDSYWDAGDTKAREAYRVANPRADFVLWFLGIVSTLRSDEAFNMAQQYAPGREAKRAER